MDVTIGHPLSKAAVAQAAPERDGALVASLERQKRARYPHAELLPFALESQGRLGQSAVALLRTLHASSPATEKPC